jgi:ABC-type uncharacterized transport system involved in gliding motility auxiliary subunit
MTDKKNIRIYALIAVGVAALACLASGVIGLLLGLNVLGWFTPMNIETWKQAFWTSLVFIGIGVSVYGILMPDQVRRFLSGRQARYGSNSLILALAVIGILTMVNILAYQNPVTISDMTTDKLHTLAPETLQALGALPGKVTATAFFSTQMSTTQADELLNNFTVNSKGMFDYRFVDPDSDPVTVNEAGITGDGKILLEMGGRQAIASYADESELMSALLRLTNPGARAVYFLTGHGEPDITAQGETSMTIAKSALEGKNYTVNPLNLLAENKIPEDALAVIIAGPLKPLSASEVDLLKAFVEKGGGLVVCEDPLPLTDFGSAADPLAAYLQFDWGILLNNDMVIDLTNNGQELLAVTSSLSNAHPITRGMTQVAILPNARSLSATATGAEGLTITSLGQTTDQSWGESDFASLEGQSVKFDEGADVVGPLNLAMAGESSVIPGRVVVFGNSAFALDLNFDKYGNGDIFINSVDWAAAQDDLIQLTSYGSTERVFKDPTQVPWVAILLFSVFVLPGMIIIAGFVSWLSRRRRG